MRPPRYRRIKQVSQLKGEGKSNATHTLSELLTVEAAFETNGTICDSAVTNMRVFFDVDAVTDTHNRPAGNANANVLVKITIWLGVIFLVTTTLLARIYAQGHGRTLMERAVPVERKAMPVSPVAPAPGVFPAAQPAVPAAQPAPAAPAPEPGSVSPPASEPEE